MKKIPLFLSIVLIIGACASQKPISKSKKADKNIEIAVKDSTEYELLTFDIGFKSWYAFYENRSSERSLYYYKNWNKQYVNDWNARARSYSESKFFSMTLNFDPEDFNNLALQKELFYYFQYVENKLKLKILYGYSPKVVF